MAGRPARSARSSPAQTSCEDTCDEVGVVVVRCCGVAAAARRAYRRAAAGQTGPRCGSSRPAHQLAARGQHRACLAAFPAKQGRPLATPLFNCRAHLRWSHLAHQLVLGSTTHTMPCSGGEEGGRCVHRLPACPAVTIQSRAIRLIRRHCRVAGAVGWSACRCTHRP